MIQQAPTTMVNEEDGDRLPAIQKFLNALNNKTDNELNFEFLEIRKEQMVFQSKDEYQCCVGQKFAHFVRNRYRDILPYDRNRVKLESSSNPDGYINASHISHAETSLNYIAAQAPMCSTMEDFWAMVFENDVRIVIMLCKCVENGVPKCDKYWTEAADEEYEEDEPSENPRTTAKSFEEHTFDDFTWRKLRVWNAEGEERVLNQLHFTEWPDHGCPNGEHNVLKFVEQMVRLRNEQTDAVKQTPILFHCSAGVGRTGSVIALDIFRQKLLSEKLTDLSVKQLVVELRKQRACMVQTPGQYQFLHKCIALFCKKILEDNSHKDETATSSTNDEKMNGVPSKSGEKEECLCVVSNGVNGSSSGDHSTTIDTVTSTLSEAEQQQQAVDVRF